MSFVEDKYKCENQSEKTLSKEYAARLIKWIAAKKE